MARLGTKTLSHHRPKNNGITLLVQPFAELFRGANLLPSLSAMVLITITTTRAGRTYRQIRRRHQGLTRDLIDLSCGPPALKNRVSRTKRDRGKSKLWSFAGAGIFSCRRSSWFNGRATGAFPQNHLRIALFSLFSSTSAIIRASHPAPRKSRILRLKVNSPKSVNVPRCKWTLPWKRGIMPARPCEHSPVSPEPGSGPPKNPIPPTPLRANFRATGVSKNLKP